MVAHVYIYIHGSGDARSPAKCSYMQAQNKQSSLEKETALFGWDKETGYGDGAMATHLQMSSHEDSIFPCSLRSL